MNRTQLYCTDHVTRDPKVCLNGYSRTTTTTIRAARHHNRLSRWDLGRAGALVSRTRGLMVMNERVGPSQGWNPR